MQMRQVQSSSETQCIDFYLQLNDFVGGGGFRLTGQRSVGEGRRGQEPYLDEGQRCPDRRGEQPAEVDRSELEYEIVDAHPECAVLLEFLLANYAQEPLVPERGAI